MLEKATDGVEGLNHNHDPDVYPNAVAVVTALDVLEGFTLCKALVKTIDTEMEVGA